MKEITTVILILNSVRLIGQPVEPIQVEWNEKLYWKYLSVDQYNNTPFKFNYQYDSSGQYLGWIYQFPRDGEWINFFKEDSAKVASIFHVRDSMLNGNSIQYFLSGKKQSEYEFQNRQKIGYMRYWNENGVLTLEHQYEYKDYGHFQSSVRVGEWKNWDEEGNIVKINHFQDNELHGQQLAFYTNGKNKVEAFYTNGERDSTLTEYHSNGQIFRQVRYRRGEFVEDNPSYEYNLNGQISGKGNIEQGRKEGLWKYFYENGAIESEGNYSTYVYAHEHGDLFFYHKQGVWEYWFANGKLKATGTYEGMEMQDMDFGSDPNIGLGIRKNDWKYFDEQGVEITHQEFIKQGFKVNDN